MRQAGLKPCATSGVKPFTYDAIGRLTADGRGTYTYTPTNRIASATTPAGTATCVYTADEGRIVSDVVSSPVTRL